MCTSYVNRFDLNDMKIDLLVNNINTKIVGNLSKQVLTSLSESMKYKTSEYNGYTFVDVEHELFHKLTQSFPTGLYSKAADVLESNGIDFDTIDKRKSPIKTKSLPLHNVTPHDFQHQLINDAVKNQRFVVQVATGGGKTVIGAGILAKLNLPSIFVVHTGDLFEQSYDELTRFLKVPIGRIGGGVCDIQKINVCMIQTIHAALDQEYKPYDDVEKELMEEDEVVKKSFNRNKAVLDFLQTVQVVLIDECFHGKTPIMIDYGKQVNIRDIYENEFITHVISYNHEKNVLERKKILRKMKTPLEGKWHEVTVQWKDKIVKLKVTENHKFWTKNRGYIPVKDLTTNDILKFYTDDLKKVTVCEICGKVFEHNNNSGHYAMHNGTNPFTNGNGFITRSANKNYCNKISKRMSLNNPSYKDEVKQKIGKSWQKTFLAKSEKEQNKIRQRWINLPKYNANPTSFEQKIIDLGIKDIAFTGNGKFWLTLGKKDSGKKWSKNPDFKIRRQRKVIEVGDICYWHSEEEIQKVINAYKKINFECLYLTNDDFKDENWEQTTGKIFKFIYNHDEAKVISVKYLYSAPNKQTQFKYNLEIEDNHNYFANGVLVSNCHHIRANSYINVMKACKNAFYRGGLSATPHSGDGKDIILQAYAGSIIGKITASYLIERGLLVQPTIYYLNGNKIDKYIYSRKRYNSICKKYIVTNTFRNKKIVECVERFQELDKTVLITVTTKKHGQILQQAIKKLGYDCEFIYSGVDRMQRKVHIQNVRERKLKIIIGTSLDYNETIWIRNSKKLVNLVKIGEFVETHLNGFDDDYETLSFSDDKIVWKKITHVHKHKCQNEVLRTRLKSGRMVQVTENHSLIAYDNGRTKEVLPIINEKIITALRIPLQNKLVKEFNLLEEYANCPFANKLEVRLDRNQDFLQFNNSTMRLIKSEYTVLKKQYQNISGDTEKNAVERLKGKDKFYKDFVIWFNENVEYHKRKYRCSLDSILNFKHYKKLKAKIYYKRSNEGDFGLPFVLQNSIELGHICGMLIGDGHMSKDQFCLCFKGQRSDAKFIKEKSVELMSSCLKKIFPDLKFKRGHNETTGIKIAGKLMSYLVWEILNLKGNAIDKKVPQFIFNSSKEIQMAFLYGYFLTDGSFNNTYSFSFVSISKILLDGIIGILLNNNINNFSFKCRKPNLDSDGHLLKSGRRIKSKNMGYQLTVRDNLFGFSINPGKPGQSYLKHKINNEFANVPITKVEKMYTLENRTFANSLFILCFK